MKKLVFLFKLKIKKTETEALKNSLTDRKNTRHYGSSIYNLEHICHNVWAAL